MNGIDCKLYYNSATYGTPTWAAIDDVKDLTVSNKYKESDASTRAYIVEFAEPNQMQIEISGMVRVSLAGTVFVALDAAFLARTLLDIMVLNDDSAANGARGWRLDMKMTDWSEDQKIDGVLYRSITLKPCLPTNAPKSVLVTTGAPVFTSIA